MGAIEPCRRNGCINPAARGQVYCSRDCAPLGRVADTAAGKRTRSETTAVSGTRERGERFQGRSLAAPDPEFGSEKNTPRAQNSDDRNPNSENAIPRDTETWNESGELNTGRTSPSTSASGETENASSMAGEIIERMKNSAPVTPEIEPAGSRPYTPGETNVIPPESSGEHLLRSAEAALVSMSTVDESISLLHGQLKRICLSDEKMHVPYEQEVSRASVALQTAAVMAKMIRLKVDAAKVALKYRQEGQGK